MDRFARLAVVCVLVPHLALGSGAPALSQGFVVSEKGSNLIKGSTVYSDSVVGTQPGGHALINLTSATAKVHVLGGSEIRFVGGRASPVVHLVRGAVGFDADATANVEFVVSEAVVKPVSGKRATGEIRVLANNEIRVAAIGQALEVSHGEDVLVVPAGTAYMLKIEPQGQQDPAGKGAPQAVRRRTLLILGSLMIAATTGIGIWLSNRDGGAQPGTVVSPVVP